MSRFSSQKLFDGYSTCFRQWRAGGTHCKYIHGYGVSFKIWFEGELDHRNWVFDFGGLKRSVNLIEGMKPDDYFKWLLDHTYIVAKDDPELELFKSLNAKGIIVLRILENVGCEQFAKHIYDVINDYLILETQGRVKATKVEFYENNKNSASYEYKPAQTLI